LEQKEGNIVGTALYYYPNGQLWLEMPFKEGQIHGVVRSYHPNGRIQAVKPYKNGKLHGERFITDSAGMPANGEYVELLPYDSAEVVQTCVKGLPHGFVVVKRAGHKVLEGNCANGLAEGAFVIFDKNGTVVGRDYYRKGKFKRSEQISPKKVYE
jgi:antitoxin component YwqK of YwqJK toxin-antitoxin module